jgi:hypothetical protein
VCGNIRRAFVGQEVPRGEYAHLIGAMPGRDVDDHPHAAAAVARAPSTILTANTKDFPTEPLAERRVTVRRPDDYLTELFDRRPDEVVDIVSEMAADRRDPLMTPIEVTDALDRAGVPAFAARAGQYIRPVHPMGPMRSSTGVAAR